METGLCFADFATASRPTHQDCRMKTAVQQAFQSCAVIRGRFAVDEFFSKYQENAFRMLFHGGGVYRFLENQQS